MASTPDTPTIAQPEISIPVSETPEVPDPKPPGNITATVDPERKSSTSDSKGAPSEKPSTDASQSEATDAAIKDQPEPSSKPGASTEESPKPAVKTEPLRESNAPNVYSDPEDLLSPKVESTIDPSREPDKDVVSSPWSPKSAVKIIASRVYSFILSLGFTRVGIISFYFSLPGPWLLDQIEQKTYLPVAILATHLFTFVMGVLKMTLFIFADWNLIHLLALVVCVWMVTRDLSSSSRFENVPDLIPKLRSFIGRPNSQHREDWSERLICGSVLYGTFAISLRILEALLPYWFPEMHEWSEYITTHWHPEVVFPEAQAPLRGAISGLSEYPFVFCATIMGISIVMAGLPWFLWRLTGEIWKLCEGVYTKLQTLKDKGIVLFWAGYENLCLALVSTKDWSKRQLSWCLSKFIGIWIWFKGVWTRLKPAKTEGPENRGDKLGEEKDEDKKDVTAKGDAQVETSEAPSTPQKTSPSSSGDKQSTVEDISEKDNNKDSTVKPNETRSSSSEPSAAKEPLEDHKSREAKGPRLGFKKMSFWSTPEPKKEADADGTSKEEQPIEKTGSESKTSTPSHEPPTEALSETADTSSPRKESVTKETASEPITKKSPSQSITEESPSESVPTPSPKAPIVPSSSAIDDSSQSDDHEDLSELSEAPTTSTEVSPTVESQISEPTLDPGVNYPAALSGLYKDESESPKPTAHSNTPNALVSKETETIERSPSEDRGPFQASVASPREKTEKVSKAATKTPKPIIVKSKDQLEGPQSASLPIPKDYPSRKDVTEMERPSTSGKSAAKDVSPLQKSSRSNRKRN